jgi:hypothetical protein
MHLRYPELFLLKLVVHRADTAAPGQYYVSMHLGPSSKHTTETP